MSFDNYNLTMNVSGFHSRPDETMHGWTKQWFQEGHVKDIAQGVEQGLDHQRALLARLAIERSETTRKRPARHGRLR